MPDQHYQFGAIDLDSGHRAFTRVDNSSAIMGEDYTSVAAMSTSKFINIAIAAVAVFAWRAISGALPQSKNAVRAKVGPVAYEVEGEEPVDNLGRLVREGVRRGICLFVFLAVSLSAIATVTAHSGFPIVSKIGLSLFRMGLDEEKEAKSLWEEPAQVTMVKSDSVVSVCLLDRNGNGRCYPVNDVPAGTEMAQWLLPGTREVPTP